MLQEMGNKHEYFYTHTLILLAQIWICRTKFSRQPFAANPFLFRSFAVPHHKQNSPSVGCSRGIEEIKNEFTFARQSINTYTHKHTLLFFLSLFWSVFSSSHRPMGSRWRILPWEISFKCISQCCTDVFFFLRLLCLSFGLHWAM